MWRSPMACARVAVSFALVSNRQVHIAGVAETPLGKVPDQTELSMVALAAREALAEAGMTLADVDGLFVNYMGEEGSVQVGEYLGIQPRYGDSSDLGGGSFERSSITACWRSPPDIARSR